MRRRDFLTRSLGLAAAGLLGRDLLAQDQKVEKLLTNGAPEFRHDILFLPEGYTAAQRAQFDRDVDSMVKGLSGIAAYKEVLPLLSASKLWLPSSGKYAGDGVGPCGVRVDEDGYPRTIDERAVEKHTRVAGADVAFIIVNDNEAKGWGGFSHVVASPRVEIGMHELGHAFGLGDEYETKHARKAPNAWDDEKELPWKELLAARARGIKTTRIGRSGWFRGEEQDCLMRTADSGRQLGPLCTSYVVTWLRMNLGFFEAASWIKEHTTESKALEASVGKEIPIYGRLIATASHIPVITAWHRAGDLDQLAEAVAKDCAYSRSVPAALKDAAKYTKLTVRVDPKTKGFSITDKLSAGTYYVVLHVADPNPAIILDPDQSAAATIPLPVKVA